eukprot:GHVL01002121.1.p1 GENE.GHVL01002121.1~~GHVL01002121.1.p1  ORF type:complete len:746 (+),score=161.78 GHVL01002121.1:718-2955(+)
MMGKIEVEFDGDQNTFSLNDYVVINPSKDFHEDMDRSNYVNKADWDIYSEDGLPDLEYVETISQKMDVLGHIRESDSKIPSRTVRSEVLFGIIENIEFCGTHGDRFSETSSSIVLRICLTIQILNNIKNDACFHIHNNMNDDLYNNIYNEYIRNEDDIYDNKYQEYIENNIKSIDKLVLMCNESKILYIISPNNIPHISKKFHETLLNLHKATETTKPRSTSCLEHIIDNIIFDEIKYFLSENIVIENKLFEKIKLENDEILKKMAKLRINYNDIEKVLENDNDIEKITNTNVDENVYKNVYENVYEDVYKDVYKDVDEVISIMSNDQKEIVLKVFEKNEGFSCVKVLGPPGTGKSRVAAGICALWAVDKIGGGDVFIITGTNAGKHSLLKAIEHYSIHVFTPNSEKKNIEETVIKLSERCERYQTKRVIVETAYRDIYYKAGQKDNLLLIIDEACQLPEIAALNALSRSCSRLVLFGDPKQLAPVQVELPLEVTQYLYPCDATLWNRFSSNNLITLKNQYRMNQILAKWPSMYFYDNLLLSHDITKKYLPTFDDFSYNNKTSPIIFVDTSDIEENHDYSHYSSGSLCNPREALIVLYFLKKFLKDISPNDIGVICSFVRQKHLIKFFLCGNKTNFQKIKNLEKNKNDGKYPQVETVDAFQGDERDYIIYTTVSGVGDDSNIIFEDAKRFNVALTRARKGLIVIGNKKRLAKVKEWESWTKFVRTEGIYKTFNFQQLELNSDKSL